MSKGNGAHLKGVHKGLGIFDCTAAGSCITHVSHCNASVQRLKMPLLKNITHKAHSLMQLDFSSIAYCNSRTLLSAVLKAGQSKIRKGSCILCPINSNNTTLIAKTHFSPQIKNAVDIILPKQKYIYGVFAIYLHYRKIRSLCQFIMMRLRPPVFASYIAWSTRSKII